jgi:hypothetical protein
MSEPALLGAGARGDPHLARALAVRGAGAPDAEEQREEGLGEAGAVGADGEGPAVVPHHLRVGPPLGGGDGDAGVEHVPQRQRPRGAVAARHLPEAPH